VNGATERRADGILTHVVIEFYYRVSQQKTPLSAVCLRPSFVGCIKLYDTRICPSSSKATTIMDRPLKSSRETRQPQKNRNWKRGANNNNSTSSRCVAKSVPKRKPRKPTKAEGPKQRKQRQQQPQQDWSVEISKESIEAYPIIAWTGPIKLLRTFNEMKNAVHEILSSGERHLGFDTETKPNFVKGRAGVNKTALVQLGTASTVYLFHISNLDGHNLDALLPILTNENITKSGIAIHNDVKDLQQIQSFRDAGFVDTSTITRDQLRIKNTGLQALTAHFMAGRLPKSKKVQMSNWAAEHLSASQIQYAATDAWVSREVHVRAKKTVVAASAAAAAKNKPRGRAAAK
jgi:ribonuclease D